MAFKWLQNEGVFNDVESVYLQNSRNKCRAGLSQLAALFQLRMSKMKVNFPSLPVVYC